MVSLGDNYRRTPSAPGWAGPPDPEVDERVFECPCGVLYIKGGWSVAHGFEPCPAFTQARRSA